MQRGRQSLVWAGMSNEIKELVSNCKTCLKYQSAQSKEPLLPYVVPAFPWQRIAADLFQLGKDQYLLVIDYFSKYVELARLEDSTSSQEVIIHLKSIMARHGIPEQLVSDNGPQFSSNRFATFAKQWEFCNNTSSPMFPSSNGQAERAIQTVKNVLRKAQESKKDVYLALLEYRNTPVDTNIPSPAELLFQRKLRTRLPCKQSMLKPSLQTDIHQKLQCRQAKVKRYHDTFAKPLEPLDVGDSVRIRQGNTWIPAIVAEKNTNPRSYHVTTEQGKLYRRNRRHLLKTNEPAVKQPTFLGLEEEIPSTVTKPESEPKPTVPTTQSSPRSQIPVPEYRTRSGRTVVKSSRYGT